MVRARNDRRVRIAASGRFASRLANARGRRSHLVRRRVMGGRVAEVRERALERANGDLSSAIVLRERSRALRVHGMRSVRRDRDAKRVNGLRPRGLIARQRKEAAARRESFAEVRARQDRIAVRGRSVRFVRAARAKDLHRGRLARALKVSAKDLRRGHRSHFVHAVRARDLSRDRRSRFVRAVRAKDLRRVRRNRIVLVVKVRAEDLHRGHRSHIVLVVQLRVGNFNLAPRSRFVLAVRVNEKGLQRDRRSRFGEVKKAVARVEKSGRSGEHERVRLEGVAKEDLLQRGLESRGSLGRRSSVRRNLAVSGSSAARRSSAASGRLVERLRLQASRSLDREQEM